MPLEQARVVFVMVLALMLGIAGYVIHRVLRGQRRAENRALELSPDIVRSQLPCADEHADDQPFLYGVLVDRHGRQRRTLVHDQTGLQIAVIHHRSGPHQPARVIELGNARYECRIHRGWLMDTMSLHAAGDTTVLLSYRSSGLRDSFYVDDPKTPRYTRKLTERSQDSWPIRSGQRVVATLCNLRPSFGADVAALCGHTELPLIDRIFILECTGRQPSASG
ncbi:MAG: hypothetical protein KDK91_14630 [Gammaproteobacteria bacterium]|nr:hypothetical protein [Gammaproteobacteria bacterium]